MVASYLFAYVILLRAKRSSLNSPDERQLPSPQAVELDRACKYFDWDYVRCLKFAFYIDKHTSLIRDFDEAKQASVMWA